MIARLKRLLPWINGLCSYLAWHAGQVLWGHRRVDSRPVSGPVCVIQIGSLGDVLMLTPLLAALTARFGVGQVDAVVTTRSAEILNNVEGLREVIRIKRPLRWRDPRSVVEFFLLARRLRNRRYEVIFDTGRVAQSAWMTFLASPRYSSGPLLPRTMGPYRLERFGYLYTHEVPVRADEHMVRQNLALLAPFGISADSEALTFTPSKEDHRAANIWLVTRGISGDQGYVVIHPGTKWPPKRWPAERFQHLTTKLQAIGLAVVVAGDAGDRRLIESVIHSVSPAPLVTAGELGLSAVAALIQGARLFIGNDSALMHLASAVGTPVIALFGPTFPDRTGPLGTQQHAIVKPIPCRPCRLYFTRDRCELGHNYCMDLIEVDEVWAAAQSLVRITPRNRTASSMVGA